MPNVVRTSITFAFVVTTMLSGPLGAGASADQLRMGGSGSATKMLERLGGVCTRGSATKVAVIPGLSSNGGILALSDGALDVAISGRPLKSEEAASGLVQVATIRTPFVLVTSHPKPKGLKGTDVADIYGSDKPTWDDGIPLRIILRPKSDSDTPLLSQLFPGMASALEKASQRRDVPLAATDQDNAAMAENVSGSLTGAGYGQIKGENRNLRFVPLDGVEPTLESFERGEYRYGKTMYFVVPFSPSPAAERFIACVRSPLGVQELRNAGNLLAD